jgi:hypothetical protein
MKMQRNTPQYYIPGATGGLAGIESLMVTDQLYANQLRLDFDHTTATHKLKYMPKYCLVSKIVVNVTEEFNGALKLGKNGVDEAYVADVDFPKTVGLSNPLMIGEPVDATTLMQLKVSGCTTGEGTIWVFWEPLI